MHSALLLLLASLAATASAHFQLQFPAPRGVFVEDNEPNFCDGYTEVTTNRTEFPLTGGFFSLISEHPSWVVEVLLSTVQDPNSFNNFSDIVPAFKASGEGNFCFPLDFSKTNATNLKAGENVTIQIVFDGGDGQLYQCADLTLADNVNITAACTNNTGTSTTTGTTGSTTTSTTASTTSTAKSNANRSASLGVGVVLGLLGVACAIIL